MDNTFKENRISVPMEHYRREFEKLEPIEAAGRTGLRYDEEKRAFSLKFLNRKVFLGYPDMTARDTPGGLTDYELILLSRYVLEGRRVQASGSFFAYTEMPWGEVYSANFKGRCIMRLAYGFGGDLEKFRRAASALGGAPCGGGDAAYELEFLNGLFMRLILWSPDEEFPPSSQILFSDNFQYAFTAEDMAVVGDVLINAMKLHSQHGAGESI